VPARLARVLLDLAARHGQAVETGIRIETRLTQGELAAMVSASRETVNRGLRSFEHRTWIRPTACGDPARSTGVDSTVKGTQFRR
jgi:CRP-like cAMP-binding protein